MLVDKIIETESLARRLFKEYGLEDWKFEFSSTKHRIGDCDHSTKTIRYSTNFLERTPMEEVEDTIRHEIAHALVGKEHGHNNVWKRMAIRVGAKPYACESEGKAVSTAKPNYVIECPSCGRKWYRYRMRSRNYGSKCPDCKVEVEIWEIAK